MTWRMRWHNKSVAIINATLQLLDIYIYIYRFDFLYDKNKGSNPSQLPVVIIRRKKLIDIYVQNQFIRLGLYSYYS